MLSRLVSPMLDLLYPHLCFACNEKHPPRGSSICVHCEFKIRPTNYHEMPNNPVMDRFWGRVELVQATTAFNFVKGGLLQKLIHQLKYENKAEIGIELGRIYGAVLREVHAYQGIDFVIPVPLHLKKKHQRGYNQAAMWGQGLAEQLGIPCREDLLLRSEYTESQTKKSRIERFQNVEHSFMLSNPNELESKHVLLVDDVLTTGATLEACALVLLLAPHLRISVACIALAD